jgi:uncharacterized membrane protein YphA (DoxX/SURF4 family)
MFKAMRKPTSSLLLRFGLALVMLAAGVAVLTGFDRMGHRFHALGAPDAMRYGAGALQMAAAIVLVVPGRAGYGAALCLCAGIGATLAHATVLGWDSAPPAMALAALSALILWQNRADLRR